MTTELIDAYVNLRIVTDLKISVNTLELTTWNVEFRSYNISDNSISRGYLYRLTELMTIKQCFEKIVEIVEDNTNFDALGLVGRIINGIFQIDNKTNQYIYYGEKFDLVFPESSDDINQWCNFYRNLIYSTHPRYS